MKKQERTRQRILDAAAAEFRGREVEAVRLSDIAARAGLQAPSLYYHFSSKEEILEEVLAVAVEQTLAAVREAVDAVPSDEPLQRLEAAIRAHVLTCQRYGEYSSVALRSFSHMPADMQKRLRVARHAVREAWLALLVEGQAAGVVRDDLDAGVVRMLLLGAINWAVEWYHPRRGLTVDELADQACLVVLDGLIAATA